MPQWTSPPQYIVYGALSLDEENRYASSHLLVVSSWVVWASPGLVHSDDSSKKVFSFPFVPIQQNMCDSIAVPLLHVGNLMGYPTRCKFEVTQNVVQNVKHSFVTYSWLPPLTHAQSIGDQHPTGKKTAELCFPLCDMATLHRHMPHAVHGNIRVYYDLVPLQFWSKNVALFCKYGLSMGGSPDDVSENPVT